MSARDVSKHTLWNIIGQVAPLIFAFVALPVLLRRLGLDRYGFLTIVWVLVGYVGVFDFGVGRAVTRVVATRLGENDRLGADEAASAALAFLLMMGCILGSAMFIFAPFIVRLISLPVALKSEGENSLRILALSLPFVLLTSGYRGYLEARRAFGALNIIRVCMGVLTYLAPLAATYISSRLESMVVAVLLMRVIANYAHRRACVAQTDASLVMARPTVARMKPLLTLGGWITVSNVVAPLMGSMDRLIIGPLVPIAAVGMYATGYDLITKILILAYSLTGAAFPLFAGLADERRAQEMYLTFLKIMLLSIWPVLFIISLFAKDIFHHWLGPQFGETAGLTVQILSIGLLFNCIAQMPAMLIQSRGAPKWMAIVHLCEIPLFLIVIYLLTKRYGVTGTALAWTLRASIDAIIMFAIVSTKLAPKAIPWGVAVTMLVAAPVAMLFPLSDLNLGLRTLSGLGIVTVFLSVGWVWLLDSGERSRTVQLVRSKLSRA